MGRILGFVWEVFSKGILFTRYFIMISMNANLNPATVAIFDVGGRLVFKTKIILCAVQVSADRLPKSLNLLETQRRIGKHTQKSFKQ